MTSFGFLILQVCGIFVLHVYVEHLVIHSSYRKGWVIKTDESWGPLPDL